MDGWTRWLALAAAWGAAGAAPGWASERSDWEWVRRPAEAVGDAKTAASSADSHAVASTHDMRVEDRPALPASTTRFGELGSWRWAIYGGGAFDLKRNAEYYNLHLAAEYFVVERLSVGFELGGIFFDEERGRDNTVGLNFSVIFRWHFLAQERWSLYADGGAGVLVSAEEVPPGGTHVNFTPQAGLGATLAIGDAGARLFGGVRWHHISNARIQGANRNPGRDSLMFYIGVSFPWE